MINIKAYTTTGEKVYLTLCFIFSGAYWLVALFLPVLVYKMLIIPNFPKIFSSIPLLVIAVFLIIHWTIRESFKAHIFGNSTRVNEMQLSEVYKIALEMAKKMGVEKIPYIFIVNEEVPMNAWAVRFIGHAYVVLHANLVDLMLQRKAVKELRAIIAHEMAHHAAGHVNFWLLLFLEPSMRIVPFLGKGYKRACEFTADRLALVVTGDLKSTQRALISLACGSQSLSSKTNIVAFMNQEVEFLLFFGFIKELFSTHPRITRRVIFLENYSKSAQPYGFDSYTDTVEGWRISAISGPIAGSAIELTTTPIVIGRDPKDSNLIVTAPGNSISRRHCTVRFDGDGTSILLEDLGSTNGTFLNSGRRLEPHMPQRLQSGDRFYLSQPDILFELQRKND